MLCDYPPPRTRPRLEAVLRAGQQKRSALSARTPTAAPGPDAMAREFGRLNARPRFPRRNANESGPGRVLDDMGRPESVVKDASDAWRLKQLEKMRRRAAVLSRSQIGGLQRLGPAAVIEWQPLLTDAAMEELYQDALRSAYTASLNLTEGTATMGDALGAAREEAGTSGAVLASAVKTVASANAGTLDAAAFTRLLNERLRAAAVPALAASAGWVIKALYAYYSVTAELEEQYPELASYAEWQKFATAAGYATPSAVA